MCSDMKPPLPRSLPLPSNDSIVLMKRMAVLMVMPLCATISVVRDGLIKVMKGIESCER